MLPGPAVPGSCLVSFYFRWAIHPIRPVEVFQLELLRCKSDATGAEQQQEAQRVRARAFMYGVVAGVTHTRRLLHFHVHRLQVAVTLASRKFKAAFA